MDDKRNGLESFIYAIKKLLAGTRTFLCFYSWIHTVWVKGGWWLYLSFCILIFIGDFVRKWCVVFQSIFLSLFQYISIWLSSSNLLRGVCVSSMALDSNTKTNMAEPGYLIHDHLNSFPPSRHRPIFVTIYIDIKFKFHVRYSQSLILYSLTHRLEKCNRK